MHTHITYIHTVSIYIYDRSYIHKHLVMNVFLCIFCTIYYSSLFDHAVSRVVLLPQLKVKFLLNTFGVYTELPRRQFYSNSSVLPSF